MRRLSTLIANTLLACGTAAQNTHALPNGLLNAAGNSTNTLPFGTTGASFPGVRVLTCYDSSNFTAAGITAPIRITCVRWRANDSQTSWTGGTFAQASVAMATATVDHLALSPLFASNTGADRRVVYTGPVDYRAGSGAGFGRPGPVVIDLPLALPFVYDPAAGDFVLDVDCPGGANYVGGTLASMDVHTGAAASRVYATTNHPLSNGVTTNHGAVVELEWTPAAGLFAAFAVNRTGGASPLQVQFTDQSFSSAPAGITSWAWDFDNNGTTDSTARHPLFTFAGCGRYTVTLRVQDGVHAQATKSRVDLIVTDAVTPDFLWQVVAPDTVQFTDTTTPAATARAWDLDGNGSIDATGPVATRVYAPGTATVAVTLTSSRLCGAPATVTKTVLPTPAVFTTFAGGNGLTNSSAGNVFDLEVLHPQGINVTALTVCPLSASTPLHTPIQCEVWLTAHAGGFTQNHADVSRWRRIALGTGTFLGATTTSATVPTPITLDRRVFLASGSYSVAIHLLGCGITYTTASGNALQFGNADVRITCGLAKSTPFSASATAQRAWNGILHYDRCALGSLAGHGHLATGCMNSLGQVPAQTALSLPVAGQTFAVAFAGLPQNIGFVLVGLSRTQGPFGALPLALAPFGAPGCVLRPSSELTEMLLGTGGTGVWSTPLPAAPALLCLPFYLQAFVLDPAANSAGWVLSDAAAGVVGV